MSVACETIPIMRIAGALVIVAGLVLAALLALIPTSISVLGTTAQCAVPAVAVFAHQPDPMVPDQPTSGWSWTTPTQQTDLAQAIWQDCRASSMPRVIAAAVTLFITVSAGVIMIAVAGLLKPTTVPAPVWYPPRG